MTQIRLILLLVALAVVATIGGCLYFKGRTDATQKIDLATARAAIESSRERQKIEHATDARVNTESTQTETTAKAANDEIERIRTNPERPPVRHPAAEVVSEAASPDRGDSARAVEPDPAATRVMQLAREARTAALESAARLQSARTSAR